MVCLKLVLEKLKKILEMSLKSHGIFSQKMCMNPDLASLQFFYGHIHGTIYKQQNLILYAKR